MIRRRVKRLLERVDATGSAAGFDYRTFVRSAYQLAFKREPDEASSRQHDTDPLQGRSGDAIQGLPNNAGNEAAADRGGSVGDLSGPRVQPEEVDNLVRLGFRSLLRRDPDPETYASYRDGFERGTTFLELITDITQSEEYQIIEERIERILAAPPQAPSPTLDHPIAGDMDAALTILEARLGEKGCALQLGAVPEGAIDGASARGRMRNLMVTLSLLDRL